MERQVADGLSLFRGDITETELEIKKFNIQVDAQTSKLINAAKAAKVSDEQTARNVEGIKARAAALKENNRELQELEESTKNTTAATNAHASAQKDAAIETEAHATAQENLARQIAITQARITQAQNHELQKRKEAAETRRSEEETAVEHHNRTVEAKEAAHSATFERKAAITTQNRINSTVTMLGAANTLMGSLSQIAAEKNHETALKMHKTAKAVGLAEVAINTARALSLVSAQTGIGVIAAAAPILALNAAQAAAIASTPPPAAHIGTGMPGSRDPLAPDERMSSGRRVLTTEASGPGGVANSMGTQLLNDVNTGRVQSTGRITAVIGRSHLDQELFRSGRRGTSRYARSLRTNPHPKPQGGCCALSRIWIGLCR